MKLSNCYLFVIAALCLCFASCKKMGFTDSRNALLFTSADSLHFDTVFTTVGSITQSFKIFNANDQKLLVRNIQLAGGNNSFFKINVDGTNGTSFSNIEIAPNDSIYVFVAITIDPSNATNLFLIQDSIKIEYNTNQTFVQLDAYGQNAVFLKNATVTKDTTWNNILPIVLFGNLNVKEGYTLTINKGTKVYCHAGAGIIIDGTLKAIGEKYDSTKIIFRNDRLDDYYKDLPESWNGITFSETSINNELTYTSLLNATNALFVRNPAANNKPKLMLAQCTITNASATGLYGIFSSINAVNCLISNCGQNIKIVAGGDYNFDHCTVTSYSNSFLSHQSPVLSINDVDENNQVFPLQAAFTNSIFYGDDGFITDEISLLQTGNNSFDVTFENVLLKGNTSPVASYINSIQNQDPFFYIIDLFTNKFDFHLQENSPCVNTGVTTLTKTDLEGKERDENPDIGCYEFTL